MAKSAPDDNERIDRDRPRTLPGVFGIDEAGSKHRVDRETGSIYVTTGGTIDRVQDVDPEDFDREMAQWIQYVEEERGWIDQWRDVDDVFEAIGRHSMAIEEAKARGLVEELDGADTDRRRHYVSPDRAERNREALDHREQANRHRTIANSRRIGR